MGKKIGTLIFICLLALVGGSAFAEDASLNRARELMRVGQLREASQTVRQFLRRQPKSSEGWELSARIHLRMKEVMLAIVEFGKAIEKNPQARAELYLARARAWTSLSTETQSDREKNIAHAIENLEQGIKRLGQQGELVRYRKSLEALRQPSSDSLTQKASRF